MKKIHQFDEIEQLKSLIKPTVEVEKTPVDIIDDLELELDGLMKTSKKESTSVPQNIDDWLDDVIID
jgi:hypothetical protein